jgi:acyl carrier protein
MDKKATKQNLRQFITDTFVRGNNTSYGDNDSFFEKEIIDSTGVLELVLFLEQTYGFKVEDEEIIPENLDSIDNLVSYIQKKKIEVSNK